MNSKIKTTVLVRSLTAALYVLIVYIVQAEAIFSSFVGVLACVVPESYQGWKLSKTEKEYEPSKWLRLVYQAMIAKWIMTAMILAISFSSSFQWNYKILFIGYLVVSVSGLLTPIFFKGKK